jgi:hypothetical protein
MTAAGIVATTLGLQGRFHNQCHQDDVKQLISFCDTHEQFQLPDSSQLIMKTRSNVNGEYLKDGKLHHFIIRAMLEEPANWYHTFTAMYSQLDWSAVQILSFGLDKCVPPTLTKSLGARVVQVADSQLMSDINTAQSNSKHSGDEVAVIGMAAQVAGANGLDEFWNLLREGVSQHEEVPSDRFGFETAWRVHDPKKKWFGNFIKDVDAFDHKFWRKTPRESSSMDPQQRLMMQVALQAVQQSGFFRSPTHEKRVGCFIGLGTVGM